MSNENLPAASVAPVLPAFYRELYQAMDAISMALQYDVPRTLAWMNDYPRPTIEEVYMHRPTGDQDPLPTSDDVRTFVAFMRDGIRTRVTP